jgi:hypothetical protein
MTCILYQSTIQFRICRGAQSFKPIGCALNPAKMKKLLERNGQGFQVVRKLAGALVAEGSVADPVKIRFLSSLLAFCPVRILRWLFNHLSNHEAQIAAHTAQ